MDPLLLLVSDKSLSPVYSLPERIGCGPASLDAMVRKSIAFQIDPGRIRRGDMRGSISLVSAEFQY
jgi:hypothetical protein